MLDKNYISKWLLSNMGSMVIDLLLSNIGNIHKFLKDEAKKTTNGMDDILVDIVIDYLSDFLEEVRDNL